jgi:hypothetical protein
MTHSQFFLIVVDEDRKQFTVEGPLSGAEDWNRAITEARDDGRKLRSCNIGSASRADTIAEWQRHYGHLYRYVEPGKIVSSSKKP